MYKLWEISYNYGKLKELTGVSSGVNVKSGVFIKTDTFKIGFHPSTLLCKVTDISIFRRC
jgi:hypothetical protein